MASPNVDLPLAVAPINKMAGGSDTPQRPRMNSLSKSAMLKAYHVGRP